MKKIYNKLASTIKPWAVQAAGRQFIYFNYNPVGDNTKVYSGVANDWERNYTYDLLGRRLTYTEGEHAEDYTYNGGNLATDIFYYHTNHLGSTAYVTDHNQNITQGFLYAPFGEITTEFNATFGNDIIPKYSFNAKELDEETGMYYYEARYYKPPVFTSRDAMMDQKPWLCPYHYCSNNPVGRVDPSGMLDGWYRNKKGKMKWDENVMSQENTPKNGQYCGLECYEINERTGNLIHYERDGTIREFPQMLNEVTVTPNEIYLTQNRSMSSNNKSGYYWNEKDLKVWESIKNSNSPIRRYVNAQVERGNFEILSAENYWDKYGYTLGHLIICREFIKMASILTPGVNGTPTIKFGGYRGVVAPVKTVSEAHVPTFNEFRSANKGQFAGYKGRGTNTAEAWKAYKAKYGNKAVFR